MLADAPVRLREALADRYPLERPLGRGGMATVYLARDVKHQRHVAIKVLHPELAAGLGSEPISPRDQDRGRPAASPHPPTA